MPPVVRGSWLAYATVMATLSRRYAKGAVVPQPVGRGYACALRAGPGQARASMTAHRMLKLLDAGRDRAAVLSRYVADLSHEDEQ